MSFLEILSLITSVLAIILGIIAILLSWEAKGSSAINRKQASDYYDKTKDLLHEIDKRSNVMEEKVSENYQNLLKTQEELINKIIIPKQQTMEEQITLAFVSKLLESSGGVEQLTELVKQYAPKEKEK